MSDPAIGQVAATAWEFVHGGGPTDNVFTSQALLYLLREGGYQEYADGGRLFEFSVEYKANGTFKSIGEMETIDLTRYDVFDAARFEQRIYAGSVVFSKLEDLRNSVANRKMDVVKQKLRNGTDSAMEGLNAMLWGDGTADGGKAFDGVQKIISSTPNTGTVGTINAALWSFWRNRQQAGTKGAGSAFENLRAALESVYNQCSLGGTDKVPTGLVSDRASFEGYKSLLTQIERLNKDSSGEPDGDIGFVNNAILFNAVPYVYDELAIAGNAYFVNKNFLKLTFLKGAFLKMLEAVDPANQLATSHRIMTVGNLCTSARRHLGVVTAIS